MKYLILVAGPTASGKTSLAIALANHFSAEIISCDSRQFYREMNIGTAKPSAQELAFAPHHFINNLSIHDDYNAGKFEEEALLKIQELHKTHDVIIMVGGSGLYFRAVCDGMDNFPKVKEEVREALNKEFEEKGIELLLEELKTKDEVYYHQVDKQNPRRIIRALEIIRNSGKPYSSFITQKERNRPFETIKIGLDIPRAEIVERINTRVDMMVKEGLAEEVQHLIKYKNLAPLNTVGYRELFEYFENKTTLENAIEQIKINTRQYAKRQVTWLRKESDLTWFNYLNKIEIINYLDDRLSK